MASTLAVFRLHMKGRGSLVKCLRKVHTFLHRSIGTNVAAHGEELRKDKTVSEEKRGWKPLHAVEAERQEQADRSVLISFQTRTDKQTFLKYLSKHGPVNKYFFYENNGPYAVVEFESRESVASLLKGAAITSINDESVVPFKSRLLSVKGLGSSNSPKQQKGYNYQPLNPIPMNELLQRLSRENSIDQQMILLTDLHQLTDENSRLRYLVCSLVKDVAAAYFPECTIKPFGSSVNGFGKMGCDLDMILDLDGITGRNTMMPRSGLFFEYQMKSASSERAVTQNILSVIAASVEQFGAGCVAVQKILKARCPLVKFTHQPSGFQCDLTANNRMALKSTELLYLYGELDPRVRFLVFSVRCWARSQSITKSVSGTWITNFSLTVMVLFFLQKRNPSIIPTLDHLRDLAGPADKNVIEGNDCTFVSDISKIQLQSNTETLEQLLREFFLFYSTFSFMNESINIRKGKEQNKPEPTPMHIQNPFETSLNVSKNVNAAQLERFVALCQESAWLLEHKGTLKPEHVGGSIPQPWGFANLLVPTRNAQIMSRKKRRQEDHNGIIKVLLDSLKHS
ncbi:poly(A) RNA polymerase, mitochondrial [Centropristis striata]|uniref:poly(A) RNA polymerase, mitochondrial n=1 Tax=Centropristis striata TaxID=184440 RepID=UPI0027E0154D|nr:poly(A) RNA polymerase, mitochondrial [Centropristis striata]